MTTQPKTESDKKAIRYRALGHLTGAWAYFICAYNSSAYKKNPDPIMKSIGYIGIALLLYCFYLLYSKWSPAKKHLLTDGLFRYTRHPMYTALAMSYAIYLDPANYSPLFWMLTAAFAISILMAGYFQEKEVLERFGNEARVYYQKTPRLFLLYPFVRLCQRQRA